LPDKPEVLIGDLLHVSSLQEALKGIDVVITTANSAAPRKKSDTFKSVDIQGYKNLIDEAKKHSIRHFIYTSVKPVSNRFKNWIPILKSKIIIENYLKYSGLTYTIFQPDAFMDVYFTFMGTTLTIEGDEAPLVDRPFKFMQTFFKNIKNDMEKGKIGIIGDGTVKHNYITVDNTAQFIVKAIEEPEFVNKAIPLGGPEALSALEIKAVFEKVLGKPLKTKSTPAFVMKLMGNLLAPFNPAASNIMKLNYLSAVEPSVSETTALAEKLDMKLTTAEEFLEEKMAMAERKNISLNV
jgi:uncharacterized protein YbjT (DUF2867 family)